MEPFRIHVPDEVIDDLRVRLRHARWPDQVPGIGWQQGTELEWLRALVSYWERDFDWRAWEQRLNALDQFTWEGVHFVHQRSKTGRGIPLILTHGWPGSFLDFVEVLPMLEDFDVIVPSLPGYGFSPRPARVGVNYRYVAGRWHELMSALGYARYGAAGYDFGAGVTTILALDHAESVIGIHLTTLESDLTPVVEEDELSAAERAYLAVIRRWEETERGYSAIQSTKPQTVGYGLNDSPVGLAAYVGEKWRSWSEVTPSPDFLCATLTLYWVTQTITSSMRDYWDNRWHMVERAYVGEKWRSWSEIAPSPEFLCATLTLYWVTQTITSSMRDYWDNRWHAVERAYVATPTAFGVFAHQTVPEGEPPRAYLERVYNIRRWTVFPRGGHFAPVEQPAAVAGDLAAFFRELG